jgi:Tol biopolymer transport system component
MFRKLFSSLLMLCLSILGPAAVAGAAVPLFNGASEAGDLVFFTTTEQLVPGDTDSRVDIYQRSFEPGVGDFVTRQLSTGPRGGNDAVDALFQRAAKGGTRIFFQTAEPLVSADTDRNTDVYAREVGAGSPELVTVGESGQNGAEIASFAGVTPDGEKVFFTTLEPLSAADQDGATDIYERDLATDQTYLVSVPAAGCASCEPGAFPAFNGVAAGGQRAFFASAGKLTAADTDTALDIYARDLPSGPTELVSAGQPGCLPGCGNDPSQDAVFAGSSSDGTKAFFETAEDLGVGDEDLSNDLYERAGGTTTLISPGSEEKPANISREGSAFKPAISSDGTKVFFETTEALLADSDSANDVYEYSTGTVRLITPNGCVGSGCGAAFETLSSDASTLAFSSEERLDPGDEDESSDIYVVATAGGAPILASAGAASCSPDCGNGDPFPAIFKRLASDAPVLLFTSREKLSPLDGDSSQDLYARDLDGEDTEIVSVPGVCPLPAGCDAGFVGASDDASHVFFLTPERLDADDVDSEADLYDRDRLTGVTRLVSRKNEATIGPAVPVLTGTDPPSPGVSTTPAVLGRSDPETTIKLYRGAGCQGLPIETQSAPTAGQLEGTGLVVSVEPGSTTTFSASAGDTEGVESGCSGTITYVQQDPTPPPTDEGGGGDGGTSSGGTGVAGSGGTVSDGGTATGGGSKRGPGGLVYVTPDARITFGPAAKTRVRRPVFRFFDATGQPGSIFSCKVDRQRWKGCSSPFKLPRVGLGRHTFSIKAINAVGVPTPSPVRRSFKVVR